MVLHKERFDISELIKKTLLNFEKEFRNKNITLTTDMQAQYLVADRDKIAQIIVNILSNALKYTNEGGRIAVTVTGDVKDICISIKDNGNGIAQENLPFIFERFYRADKSRSRTTGGSGIGLTIVKSLVEAHADGCLQNYPP